MSRSLALILSAVVAINSATAFSLGTTSTPQPGNVPQPVVQVSLSPLPPPPGGQTVVTVEVQLPSGFYQDADSSFLNFTVLNDWPQPHPLAEGPLTTSTPQTRRGHASFQGRFTLSRTVQVPPGPQPSHWSVRFSYQICQIDGACLLPSQTTIRVNLAPTPTLTSNPQKFVGQTAHSSSSQFSGPPLWAWLAALGAAFLGGLILNLMPCVFPVLSLKALAVVKASGENQRIQRLSSLRFASGEAASLLLLGLGTAAVKLAGGIPIWGGLFQLPAFVLILIVVFWFFALSLWDIGPRFAPSLRSAPATDFANGAVKVLAAAPCTAPFLGPALGFAFALPAWSIPLFFLAIALGLALPDLLLAAFPAIFKLLPRPGAWTKHFEQFMGFLLAGTALYMVWIYENLAGSSAMWVILVLLWGLTLLFAGGDVLTKNKRPWIRRLFFSLLALIVLVVGLILSQPATASAVSQRPSPALVSTSATSASRPLPAGWKPFTRQQLQQALAEGRPVFVDATAAWCATCLVNENGVLADPEVQQAFKTSGALLLRADFTRPSTPIADWLNEVGRAGLPVYALYVPGKDHPHLFPELLEKQSFLSEFSKLLNRP
ncbi:MAG: hypothetical protein HKM05_08545 [Spirochaetales bacterium]|nr:hypothetical protein [Spirochaetales bacterium]